MKQDPKSSKRGTYVSRSVYTKLQMENKRLLNDLHTICMKALTPESLQVRLKWKAHFEKAEAFVNILKGALLLEKTHQIKSSVKSRLKQAK